MTPVVGLPRVVIAAPSTGQGKTTVATGLMAALRAAGHQVSGHKIGPDYIDPSYHALATGRPGRNLDPHLVGEQRINPLLLHGAAGADVAVIEGVMGLFDGKLGTNGFASTAHVAKLTGSPVLLVVDVARMSRTAAAIAAGMRTFDSQIHLAGVVLNRTGSSANDTEIATAIESVGLPIVGMLPSDPQLVTPSRHLGLVTAAEHQSSAEMIDRLSLHVAKYLDISAILDIAAAAPPINQDPWDPAVEVRARTRSSRPVVAMASGPAFTFCYAETSELLRAAGCDPVTFDPLTDSTLPPGTSAIYLGGGFPEEHAARLAGNTSLLGQVKSAVAAGMPTVAECAGLLYLARSLDGAAMTGAVAATAVMTERLTLRYPVAEAASDSLLTTRGEQVTGHEFHRTITDPVFSTTPAWLVDGEPTGFADDTLHASYLHTHWAGHPQLAQRFADAAHRYSDGPDLRHHGDAEVADTMADFAVNVYPGARPDWLEQALVASLADSVAYPEPTVAVHALAALHGRRPDEVLATAGAAEAFSLVASMRPWRKPVVIHPQFTEPHVALELAGHRVTTVLCDADDNFALDVRRVPEDADLVVVGNPTNPTGVLHTRRSINRLRRPGRLVVVDEAFMDAVVRANESLITERGDDIVVLRSLTKHWSIPGIRAGYVIAHPAVINELAQRQIPWSVSTPAIAAMQACSSSMAAQHSLERAEQLASWRGQLAAELTTRRYRVIESAAPFVLVQIGAGVHGLLRERGVAVRRADTFPGLDATWVRIAARPPHTVTTLLTALDQIGQQ